MELGEEVIQLCCCRTGKNVCVVKYLLAFLCEVKMKAMEQSFPVVLFIVL